MPFVTISKNSRAEDTSVELPEGLPPIPTEEQRFVAYLYNWKIDFSLKIAKHYLNNYVAIYITVFVQGWLMTTNKKDKKNGDPHHLDLHVITRYFGILGVCFFLGNWGTSGSHFGTFSGHRVLRKQEHWKWWSKFRSRIKNFWDTANSVYISMKLALVALLAFLRTSAAKEFE